MKQTDIADRGSTEWLKTWSAIALVGFLLATGSAATWTMWKTTMSTSSQAIAAGNLDLELGESFWRHFDVDGALYRECSAEEICDTPVILTGETLEVYQPVTTTIEGSNLHAYMTVRQIEPTVISPTDGIEHVVQIREAESQKTAAQMTAGFSEQPLVMDVEHAGKKTWHIVQRFTVVSDGVRADIAETVPMESFAVQELSITLAQSRDSIGGVQ